MNKKGDVKEAKEKATGSGAARPAILIVDDDEEIRTQMKWALTDEFDIVVAGDRASAVAAYQAGEVAVTLLDLGLPPSPNDPEEGMATLSELRALGESAKVIIISGQGEKETAMRAVGSGAYDFLCKPIDVEELKQVLRRCIYLDNLEKEYRLLQNAQRPEKFEGMFSASRKMQAVFAMIGKVAKSTAPVLILGESGVGKEMVANAIHRQSPRAGEPLITINCSAIPENLIESELFGHEKGSFTGADRMRKGLIESAMGGTLFLDEIGDLPAPMQVKLLRFLQDKRLKRVGGREEFEIDTRVVAATNADLKKSVEDGTFREDLYFRLAVVVVELPPLRERGDDAVRLAQEFLAGFCKEADRKGLVFTPDALRALGRHPWPGNVRELQNRVQRAVIMVDGKRIGIEDLELDQAVAPTCLKEAREKLDRKLVERAMRASGGQITAAAKMLEVSRPTLYEIIDRLGISRDGWGK